MPYFKGTSGNPGGRPKDSAWVKELAKRRTEDAVKALGEALGATRLIVSAKGDVVAEEPDHRVRVLAANALLDRGYGKPAQEVTGEINVTNNAETLHERIIAIVAEARGDADADPTGEPH